MNVLIAFSLVYDFSDILERNMLCNNLMWIFFIISILSMIFIDIIIVHHGTTGSNIQYKNDKYRVETFKLAIFKDEEYVLNNQCLWYTVPRKDWGNYEDINKKKYNTNNNKEGVNIKNTNELKQKKDTKSFFIRIGLGKDEIKNNNPTSFENQNHNQTTEDESSDDFDVDTTGMVYICFNCYIFYLYVIMYRR